MNQGPQPALHVWAPPSGWRNIDFISDLHLSAVLPRTVQAWSRVLRESRADAVCLLGDVFEAWVGDDSRHQDFERGLVDVLLEASRRRAIMFMPGNRDFLVGPELCTASGMQYLPDPTCLQAWGGRWLLCHGDAQCLDDTPYQAFRQMVRSVDWQAEFLAKPLAERIEVARAMRRKSGGRQPFDGDANIDLDPQACRDLLRQAGASTMLHGHTHRPAAHDLGEGLSRLVLSDWDFDDSARCRGEVMRLRDDGSLGRLSLDEACSV